MTGGRRAYPTILLVLLTASVLSPSLARADPTIADEGGGIKRATWDFGGGTYTATNVSLAASNATLASNTSSKTWSGADFPNWRQSAVQTFANDSGVRLEGNTSNLVRDGTFDQSQGDWTYANGTTRHVLAARDPSARAKLWHDTLRYQFDSMDDCCSRPNWTYTSSSVPPVPTAFTRDVGIVREGSASLRFGMDFTGAAVGSWTAALRNDAGTWPWADTNRLAAWVNSDTAGGFQAYVHLENLGGANPWDSNRSSLQVGWTRYVFDLTPWTGDPSQVDLVQIRFTNTPGAATVYVDDIVRFNYTRFDETASVSQVFQKPNATSGDPSSVVLRFDLTATPSVNVASYLQVTIGGPIVYWELPVFNGTRSPYVDLSSITGTSSFLLNFSLNLSRTSAEEASMAVWIDNVTITATDYQNGTFTSAVWDLGGAAIWQTATLTATEPNETSANVETRSGNTSSGTGPSWTAWQPLLGGPTIQSPPNRYLQWQLRLSTLNGSVTPVVTSLVISYAQHRPSGVIVTASFLPSEPLVRWREFLANDTQPPGTNVSYELSLGGSPYAPVVNAQNLSALPNTTAMIRASLLTVNASVSPTIHSFALRYEYFDSLARITITPTTATPTADDTANFSAIAWDQWGHVLRWFGCTWWTSDPWGYITGNGTLNGTYRAGRVGAWQVWCYNSDRSKGAAANVTVLPGRLASILVMPSPWPMPVATRWTFTADGRDADGNAVALVGTEWSTTVGQIAQANATQATLQAPPTPGSGDLTATVGAISGSALVNVTSWGTPRINGTVPDQVADEDAQAWLLNLTSFAGNQPDVNDTLANLKWVLVGVDSGLYSVFGADTFNSHVLWFRPKPDAFGTNQVQLSLEDMDGARSFQYLNITIRPVNDPPFWKYAVPDLYVKFDEPYTFDFLPYIRDVDTPADKLTLTTEDPTHITIHGLNATFAYDRSYNGQTLYVYHRVTDDQFGTALTIVTIHVIPDSPVIIKKPLPPITITEDVPAIDVFPESLTAYFESPQGHTLFYTSNFTHLEVAIWDDAVKVRVNVTGDKDFCGSDRVTFRAKDDVTHAFAEQTVRVTVVCVNDAPVLAWRDDVHVAFDMTYRLDLTPYVFDVDNAIEDLTLTTSDPAHAAVDRLTISFLYTRYEFPNAAYVLPLDLTLSDGIASTLQRIDVILSSNRPPELTDPFLPLQFDEDTSAIVDLSKHFLDFEDGTNMVWSANAANFAFTFAGSKVTLTPKPNWNGEEVVIFRATDPQGAFALGYLPVDVLPVDDAPVLTAPLPQVRGGGGTWVLDLRPYVSDVDNAIEDLTFTTNSPRVQAIGFLLVFNYPNADAAEEVVVTVRDPGNLTASATVSVKVTGPSILTILGWPWSGLAAFVVAALAYVAYARLAQRRFSIEDLFLIGREGRLIMHTTRRLRADRDSDILSGMLTAIMLFVRDSFREENEDLKRFEFGDRKVAVERGANVIGAAIFAGEVPEEMSVRLRYFVKDVEDRYGSRIARWSGDLDDLPGLKGMMEDFGRRGKWRVGDWRKLAGPDERTEPVESEGADEGEPSGEGRAEDEL